MIKEAIAKAAAGNDLNEAEMTQAMKEIMEGQATPAQIGAFLMALRIKGECLDEIAGAARVMRSKVIPIPCRAIEDGTPLIDVVGTGGDGAGTFNVSTTAAFVVAGAGGRVAKHGNRAISSHCGAADLLEALGVRLDIGPEEVGECIDEVGLGFLFAPNLHPAMRHATGPRREIGLRTVFNLLGPLTNPAGAEMLLVGVYQPDLVVPLAEVLGRLGAKSAFVAHGEGGMDEITVTGETILARLHNGRVSVLTVSPEDMGLSRHKREEIAGGEPKASREHTLGVLKGQAGAKRDMVLMNTSAALVAAGLATDFTDGVAKAAQSIDSGAAMAKLDELVAHTNQIRPQAAEA